MVMDMKTEPKMKVIFLIYLQTFGLVMLEYPNQSGNKIDDNIHPLKLMSTENAHRKFILENAKFIPSKVRSRFKNAYFSKDLIPQQREERRRQIISKKEQRKSSRGEERGADPYMYIEQAFLSYISKTKATVPHYLLREKSVSNDDTY